MDASLKEKKYKSILRTLLEDDGLGYGNLPKGLLKFHAYGDENRTPVEEHFVEGAQYGTGKDNTVRLHFTVSPEHQQKFEQKVAEVKPAMEKNLVSHSRSIFLNSKRLPTPLPSTWKTNPLPKKMAKSFFALRVMVPCWQT